MRRIVPVFLCLVTMVGARADVIEFQDGTKSEARVLALFNQRFEVAGKDGTVTHVNLQQVKRIDFDSQTATLTTRKHTILNGVVRSFENGSLVITPPNGADQRVAAVDVDDLTISAKDSDPPSRPPPPAKPATIPASSSRSRPQGEGSIKLERGKITIVDFYADWCGPCRHISPILDKIAAGNPDIALQKINYDKNRDLAQEYNVTAIPHIIIYDKNGKEVETVVGANELRIRQAIKTAGGS
jgi:thioredoxin 1